MGKGSELWDDSALINSFDPAKEMHSTINYGKSTKEGKHASDRNEKDLPVEKTAGHVVSEDNSNNIFEETTKTSHPSDNADNKVLAVEDISTQGNNFCADGHNPGADPCSSGFLSMDEKNCSYFDHQSVDYDQLVSLP